MEKWMILTEERVDKFDKSATSLAVIIKKLAEKVAELK
jgi:hypothetical protein